MAKTRTVRLEGVVDDDPEDTAAREQAELDELNAEEDGDLFRVTDELRALGTGVQLLITRTYPNTPDMAGYVGEMSLGEYDAEEFYNRFGPGRYKVRLRGPKGLIKGGGSVHIAKRAAPPSGGAGGVSDIASLLKVLNEREDAKRREESERKSKWMELAIPGALACLAAVLGRAPPQGPDIASLIVALKPPPPLPAPTMAELTQSLTNLKSLTETKGDDSKLDTILKVMEFAKTMAGDGGEKGDSNWIDVIRDLLKEGPAMVQPLLENLRSRQQEAMTPIVPQMTVVPVQARPVAGVAAPINTVAPTTTKTDSMNGSENSGETDMIAFFMPMIRAQLDKLVQWAVANKRVELYAEVFLEELPEITHKYVTPVQALEYLRRPDALQTVIQYEPRLATHTEWLSAMLTELIDIIDEQVKTETQDVPEQITDSLNGESVE